MAYHADVEFLEECNPALIERNAAEFARLRDLLVSSETSIARAKDGTIWESEYRAGYDARLTDVRNLVTGLSDGFGQACTALLRYADGVEKAKQHLTIGLRAETALASLVSSVAAPITRTAQQAEPMRQWEDIRDTTGFLDWVAELGMDVESIRGQANRAYEQADEAFSRAQSIEAAARQDCLAELRAAYRNVPDFRGGDFRDATDIVAQLIPLQSEAAQARNNPLTHLPGSGPKTDGFPDPASGAVSPTLQQIRNQLASLPAGVSPWYHDVVIDWSESGRRDWIANNKELIHAAAAKTGLPPDLIAAIAWKEVAGKPYVFDDLAEETRRAVEDGRIPSIPEWVPGDLDGDPDKTSYGPMAVQIRRGAEALGYDPDTLSDQQRDEIRSALKDPAQNLFIASKHLADLKAESQFANVPADQLTPENYQELAARYNGGPNWQDGQPQDYGREVMTHLSQAREALR